MIKKLNRDGAKHLVAVTIARNAVANLLRIGSGWTVVLLLPPVLVRTLDKPTYGIWVLILQVAAYVTVFDVGIQSAIARFVARGIGTQDRPFIGKVLSSSVALLIASAFAGVILTGLVSWQLPKLFHSIPLTLVASTRLSLLVIGISLCLTLPFSCLAGFFAGLQRNEINAIAGTAGKFTGACGTAWAAFNGQGLVGMASWTAVGIFLQAMVCLFFWQRQAQPAFLKVQYVELRMMREFASFCVAMFITQFCMILISGLDMPIVVVFDFKAAAYYGVAATLSNILSVPHSAIVSTLMPVAAGMSAAESPARMGRVLQKTTRFATSILCLTTVPLLLLLPAFLRVWVGSDYAANSLQIAEILIVAQFIRLTMLPYATIGYAAGQLHRMLVAPISEACVNLLFSVLAVRVIGGIGVALGTLVGAVVGVTLHFGLSIPRTNCISVGRRSLAWNGIVRPLLFALPLLVGGELLTRRMSSTAVQVSVAIACQVLLIVGFWMFIFEKQEHAQLKGILGHALRRRNGAFRPFQLE